MDATKQEVQADLCRLVDGDWGAANVDETVGGLVGAADCEGFREKKVSNGASAA